MNVSSVLERWRWQGDGIRVLCMLSILAGLVQRPVSAQSGFVTIDCGASPGSNYVDPDTSISWGDDGGFVPTGFSASVAAGSAASLSIPMQTLRYFPAESSPKKNCYVLPVEDSQAYLLRASFFYGNYDRQQTRSLINFQLALDSTPWANVSLDPTSTAPLVLEAITVPVTGQVLSACLIRTDELFAPFINALEVRPVGNRSYTHSPTGGNLHLIGRANFGERVKTYRFPEDSVDRIWPPYTQLYPDLSANGLVTDISTPQPIQDIQNNQDKVPEVVMQTAITSPLSFNFTDALPQRGPEISLYFSMFFAEYNTTLGPGDKLIVNVTWSIFQLPNGSFYGYIPVDISPGRVPPLTTFERLAYNITVPNRSEWSWYFVKNENSTRAPVISAVELYSTQALATATNNADGNVLSRLKMTFFISTWVGDPCFPVSWEEIQCNAAGKLISLNLSGKNLTGEIPIDINKLTALTSLNLSRNGFTGAIPSDLGELSSLLILDLSNNQLTGEFPTWVTFLPLTDLDVSNNDLSGTFPGSLTRLGPSFRYSGNAKLSCSGASCPPSPPPPPPTPPPTPPPSSKDSSSSIGPVIGGIVGGIFFIVLVGLSVLYCCWRQRAPSKPSPQSNPGDGAEPLHLGAIGQAQPYTLRAIQIATNNYSTQIGVGAFGPVFYGVLDNREVAVKKMSATSEQGPKEFATEVDLLSVIHHKNLVSLLGYCQESSERILLYEYMAGGDLRNRLHGPIAENNPLGWKERLKIAVDAAKGLEYLHHGCTPSIIHRDIKPTNILLTSKLEAKCSDFGLSKLTSDDRTHVTTMVKGTLGYVDPEYYQTGMLTEKSDVFSFGVLLLEIMCGQPPVVRDEAMVPSGQRSLSDRVRSAMSGGSIDRVVDPRLAGQYHPESVWKFAETAMSCVRANASQRPSMIKVVKDLTQAMNIQNPDSEGGRGQGLTYTADGYSGVSNPSGYPGGSSMFSSDAPPSVSSTGGPGQPYLADEMPSLFFRREQPIAR